LNNKGAVWPSTLSLVSDNGYSSFTSRSETGSYLYLVAPPAQSQAVNLAHSQFLRLTSICINRTRPVQWQLAAVNFSPSLCWSRLV